MANKIFEYRYEIFMGRGAWVTVFDSDKENLIYSPYSTFITAEPREIKLELKKSKLEEFKNLIHKHQAIFSIGEIENNAICDGIWSEFEISDGEKTIEIAGGNLWYFDHDENHKQLGKIKEKVDGQEIINAKILLEFFYEVKDFLLKAGVPNACLKY